MLNYWYLSYSLPAISFPPDLAFFNGSSFYGNNSVAVRRRLDLGMSSMATYQGFSLLGSASSVYSYGIDVGGDINGDGWVDYLIGAHGYNSATGITYLYYGGTSSSIYIYGEAAGTYSGVSVAFTGDVNKDGNEDFIIGAHGGVGKAYLIFGKPTMNNINLATLGRGGVSFLGAMASDLTGFVKNVIKEPTHKSILDLYFLTTTKAPSWL